jgi:hypothetical protein
MNCRLKLLVIRGQIILKKEGNNTIQARLDSDFGIKVSTIQFYAIEINSNLTVELSYNFTRRFQRYFSMFG